ncbi:MAG: hypothetical protein ABJN42_04880 [Roseibium sp.]|uniref:hypothetical protein n=1 Tax=Roseibium sp. TaxID=1936156 RepID=UPI00329854C8
MSRAKPHFSSLNKNEDLVMDIYDRKVTSITGDNEAAIDKMKGLRLLVPGPDNGVRVSRHTRVFIEGSVGGQNGKYVEANIIEDGINRLQQTCLDAEDEHRACNPHALEDAIEEGINIAWELSDSMEKTISSYEAFLQNGIGETGSRAARIRRHQRYEDEIKKLNNAIGPLTGSRIQQFLSPEICEEIKKNYAEAVEARIDDAFTRIGRVSKEITRLIIKDKDVMIRARRRKLISDLLKRVEKRDMVDVLSAAPPRIFRADISFSPRPDPADPDMFTVREEIASEIKPKTQVVRKKPLTAGSVESDPVVQDWEKADFDVFISEDFENDVRQGRSLSLTSWLEEKGEIDDDGTVFDSVMMALLGNQEEFKIAFIPPLSPTMSSRITDIVVEMNR